MVENANTKPMQTRQNLWHDRLNHKTAILAPNGEGLTLVQR